MINLSKSGDTIVFEFINNGHYLENGTIEVPVNSLSLVTDSSNMATFYKADSGDIFISATYDELGKTKAEMLEWFEENMVGEGIDSGAVQTQIDQSISGFADSVLYDSTSKYVEFYHGGTGGTKVYEFDASDFVIDGMIDDVRIETISGVSYLVIDFNTASGKEDIQIPLTDIFDPSNYYTKTEVDGIVSGKTSVVNLTQAEYDALVTGGTVDPTVLYNITDATPIDMSQYWTSAQTNSAITQAVSGKLDTSTFETYSGSVDTALSEKVNVFDNEVADYYVDSAQTYNGYFPSENTHLSYDEGFTSITLSGTVANDMMSRWSANIGVTKSDGTYYAPNVVANVYALSDSDFYGEHFCNVQADGKYNTSVVSASNRQEIDGKWVATLTADSGYKITYIKKYYYDLELEEETLEPIVVDSREKIYNGGQSKNVIEDTVEPELVRISTALSGKADSSAVTQEISAAVSGKQDTLSAGTNITIVDNVISAEGGGKAVSGGTNISITTGETADTINCTLPISADTRQRGTNLIFFDLPNTFNNNNTIRNFIVGYSNKFGNSFDQAERNIVFGNNNNLEGYIGGRRCQDNFVVGNNNFFGSRSSGYAVSNTAVFGQYNNPKNNYEFVSGQYNNSVSASTTFGDSGNTLFSVGNGTADNARHNAFEIRQNGDIYITSGGTDIKLQDNLGSGGGGGMTEDDELLLSTALTDLNDRKIDASEVKSNYQRKGDYVTPDTLNTRLAEYETALDEQNVEEVTAYALNDLNERFGGLKIAKITESEYAALTTKDENTLYIVVADPS